MFLYQSKALIIDKATEGIHLQYTHELVCAAMANRDSSLNSQTELAELNYARHLLLGLQHRTAWCIIKLWLCIAFSDVRRCHISL